MMMKDEEETLRGEMIVLAIIREVRSIIYNGCLVHNIKIALEGLIF
jgi:hypothetical protein